MPRDSCNGLSPRATYTLFPTGREQAFIFNTNNNMSGFMSLEDIEDKKNQDALREFEERSSRHKEIAKLKRKLKYSSHKYSEKSKKRKEKMIKRHAKRSVGK